MSYLMVGFGVTKVHSFLKSVVLSSSVFPIFSKKFCNKKFQQNQDILN